jgi:virulence-associated protein VagC
MTDTMLDTITVTLQRDAEGQFFNIPLELEFELASDVVLLIQDGNRLVIEPIKASIVKASLNKPI